MKFFQKKNYTTTKKNNFFFNTDFVKKNLNTNKYNKHLPSQICTFNKFLIKNGFFTKNKLILSDVFKNINYFILNNKEFITNGYQSVKWILDDVFSKKLSYIFVFDIITNLIKPPFVVKSLIIPKKLRKKTKQKYLVKIVYKNENKRLKSSYKQLYYYSNKFSDGSFKIRLYKALVYSFLDWKQSYLFKLKSMVFKKFFKV